MLDPIDVENVTRYPRIETWLKSQKVSWFIVLCLCRVSVSVVLVMIWLRGSRPIVQFNIN